MADHEEELARAAELVDNAEGFMSDAEFREEHDERLIRYQQASCNLLVAIFLQNQAMLDMMRSQQESDGLGGRR